MWCVTQLGVVCDIVRARLCVRMCACVRAFVRSCVLVGVGVGVGVGVLLGCWVGFGLVNKSVSGPGGWVFE